MTNLKHIARNEAGLPSYVNLEAIWAEYAPYHTMAKFDEGFADYLAGRFGDKGYRNVDAQAYDRGMEAGSRAMRAARRIEQNVGAN
jgi:hypothetical protein